MNTANAGYARGEDKVMIMCKLIWGYYSRCLTGFVDFVGVVICRKCHSISLS
jgi:hypothetical protein